MRKGGEIGHCFTAPAFELGSRQQRRHNTPLPPRRAKATFEHALQICAAPLRKAARELLASSVESEEIASGDQLLKMLERKQESLVAIDSSFLVEIAWAQYVGGSKGVKEFQANIIMCFPKDGSHCTLDGRVFLLSTFLLLAWRTAFAQARSHLSFVPR